MSGLDRVAMFAADISETPEPGTITGCAVPLGVPITQGAFTHIIEPGAFTRQTKDPARVKLLYNHHDGRMGPLDVIGHLTALWEDPTAGGLMFAARIIDSPKVPRGAEVAELVREGVLDQVSVGFEWERWTEEPTGGGGATFTHHRARLRELSVVPWGAAGEAATIRTAADDTGPTIAEWRALLSPPVS